MFDILLTINESEEITLAQWRNQKLRSLYEPLVKSWILRKKRLSDLFSFSLSDSSGSFSWDEETFLYELLEGPGHNRLLLLKCLDERSFLLSRTLDLITDGVQIYDKNACAVYFNPASRKISQIPDGMPVEGRHLLDLYELDQSFSTILTTLNTRSPVLDRVDHFLSNDGTAITTSNTAYPIFQGNTLIGAAVFEQDSVSIEKSKKRMEEIQKAFDRHETHLHQTRFSGYRFDSIVGHSQAMEETVSLAKKIAAQNVPVMLVGETGTGKEIFAQSIHRASSRKKGPFVAINCAAIPETLIESLLFGTKKGSFTGSEDKPGYLEEAQGGTLFLDELNSMSLAMQSKILRVIQENTFRRIGSQTDLKLDVRLISSCNEDPFEAISSNLLRKDLFYRLSTVILELPALRSRLEDLPDLIESHFKASSFQYVNGLERVSSEAMRLFQAYSWPGNIRELFHVLDYAQNVADGPELLPSHLPAWFLKANASEEQIPSENTASFWKPGDTLQASMDRLEQKLLTEALEYFGFNISKTAEALGIRRQSLQYRIRKYGLYI